MLIKVMSVLFNSNRTFLRLPYYAIVALTLFLASCSGLRDLTVKHDSSSSYDFYGDTIDHWSLVRQDSLWGYLSEDGNHAIKQVFSWADDFSDSMALVQYKNAYSYINHQGKLLRRVNTTYAYSFSEGLAAVQKRG